MSISGDRHLRPEPSGKLKGLLAGARTVLVRSDASYAESFAGQALLHLLVNLLARQFGVIDTVWLDVPMVPLYPGNWILPLAQHSNLLESLLELGNSVGGGEVGVEPVRSDGDATVTVLVGPGVGPHGEGPFSLVACGNGWDAFCSAVEVSPPIVASSLVPFGPMLAACLAAGMTFRYFYQVASWHTSDQGLWDFGRGRWEEGGGAALEAIELPPAHLIGLGAVGAAFGMALASAAGLSGVIIGIDPQVTDPSGRNRLVSACYDEIGQPKVDLAARLFDQTDIKFFPNKSRWPEYAIEAPRHSPPEIRREEDMFRYKWVISCVDRNIDRQNISRYLPRHILSGSTDGLVAQATYHSMDGLCECLACNHPVPTFSLEGIRERLHGWSASERLAFYEANGIEASMRAALDEYLTDPACGHVAEEVLRRLGVSGTTDWAVGFVSVAAGVMLAAYFARCAIDGVATAVGDYPERRLIFLGGQDLLKSQARRKPDCPVCGAPGVRQRFHGRWGRPLS